MKIVRFKRGKGWYEEHLRHSYAAKKGHFKRKLKAFAKRQAFSYATGQVINPMISDVLIKQGLSEKKARRIVSIASQFY